MTQKNEKRILLLVLSIFSIVAGILTLIPYAGASEQSMLGYKALCSFTPLSTAFALYIGITSHRYLAKRDAS